MTDLIRAVQQKTDVVRATIATRSFYLEGELHCPKTGKGDRLLTNLLNGSDRRFVVLTNATIINRETRQPEPKICPMLQVNIESIEFVWPEFIHEEAAE